MGLPTLDKLSQSMKHAAICIGPLALKPDSKFGENICVEYWLLKGCPVASGMAHCYEPHQTVGLPLNCRREPQPRTLLSPPQRGSPPQGRHPSAAFLAESLTGGPRNEGYIIRDGLCYWIELLRILLRNMLRLLLPPTQKCELLLNLKIST